MQSLFYRVRSAVERNQLLYRLGTLLYVIVRGLPSAINAGILNRALRSAMDRAHTVLFFCYTPSHHQNLGSIPSKLKELRPDISVVVLLAFDEKSYSFQEDGSVEYYYNVSAYVCRLFSARLFVTPWVGFSRSAVPAGAKSVHMLVSLAGIEGVYASHHFDGCDYVVCASNEQIKDFVAFNRKRNLPQITLVKGGYPKLDQQLREMPKRDQISLNHIVAYAPTHVYAANEGLASLLSHGKSIVRELLELGYHVVFRPHPASFGVQDEVACIDDIVASFGGNPSFSLDTSKNYNQTYSQCAVLITDLSGTGFTFALSQQRPAVFFAPNADAERGLHGVHFRDRERVGFVVRSIEDLRICVPAAIVNERVHSEQIERYRVETMFNPGRSETEITRALLAIFEGDSHPSFMQLEHD